MILAIFALDSVLVFICWAVMVSSLFPFDFVWGVLTAFKKQMFFHHVFQLNYKLSSILIDLYCKAIMIWNNVYIYILHYIVTFTYIFYIWCNMIYVFDCFPWILRFNIGPARENRDRVYVTDAKCPHQGGVSKPKKQPFWSPSKNGLSDKRWRKYRKIYIIYIYIPENDEKRWENDGLPCLSDIT